jgi:hypothetical protein
MRKALPVSLKGSDAKHAAVCRFVHDDEALRLAADVADDLRRPSAPDRPVHATDRITLLLDARPPARFGRPSFDKQVLQLHLLAPGKGDAPLVQIGRPRGADPKQITCKAERTPRGYHVEAAIPWKLLGRDPAARSPGMHLGLDFTLVSYDASGNPAVEMSWSAGKGSARPELGGHLFLTA